MFGLELISAGFLQFAALDIKPVSDQIECIKKPLFIHINLASNDTHYDFSKKTTDLNRLGKESYSPYGEDHFNTEIRGLTSGKQSLDHNIKFYTEEYKNEELACLQIQTVKVTMNYSPTIYVSTKFKKGTPIFKKILEHEEEHVKITQKVLKKHKDILKKKLKDELENELNTTPFSIDKMNQEKQKLQRRVRSIIDSVSRKMHKEAQIKHNQFDNEDLDNSIEYNQGIARKLEKIFKIE